TKRPQALEAFLCVNHGLKMIGEAKADIVLLRVDAAIGRVPYMGVIRTYADAAHGDKLRAKAQLEPVMALRAATHIEFRIAVTDNTVRVELLADRNAGAEAHAPFIVFFRADTRARPVLIGPTEMRFDRAVDADITLQIFIHAVTEEEAVIRSLRINVAA